MDWQGWFGKASEKWVTSDPALASFCAGGGPGGGDSLRELSQKLPPAQPWSSAALSEVITLISQQKAAVL